MAEQGSENEIGGWLFRVITPGVSLPPRYFVAGVPGLEQAQQLVEVHPDVQGDHVVAIEHVSMTNIAEFDLRPGEIKQIDAPY